MSAVLLEAPPPDDGSQQPAATAPPAAHVSREVHLNVLRLLELSMEECGRAIKEYFQSKPTNKDVQTVFSQSEGTDVALLVVQLLMAHFTETTDALILLADVSATVDDVEKTLTLPPTPHLIILCGTERVTTRRWMISLEGHVLCEGIQPTFMTGLAALFSLYYIFNLEFIQRYFDLIMSISPSPLYIAADIIVIPLISDYCVFRRFIGINPERGSKGSWGKIISKKTGKVVQKMSHTFNPHVSTLLKNLMDFE
ncbi:hypothetical protein N1851_019824 [Merluccius polli]|uniref:Uncharacterized protein n=1 Tax=Merluccius polli TaxID=89951 RepID=A0AA47MLY7_MERPO|nr:hypothetical protein N1851_019824 [Merluccius polli]